MRARFLLSAIAALLLSSHAASMQEKGGQEEFGAYEVVRGWPQPLPGPENEKWTWGSTGGIFAETPDRIWIGMRGQLPLPENAKPGESVGMYKMNANQLRPKTRWTNQVIVVDRAGKLIEAWTQHDAVLGKGGKGPHQINISPYDAAKHVWVVSDSGHAVFKFTNDGKLVMTLGEVGTPGDDEKHFNEPTDLAFLPDGSILVADGYVNSRVVKFDKDGKFLRAWGTKGTNPGQFNVVHSIAVDSNRRVYVADRSNKRIQIFDENGAQLDIWPNMTSPYTIMYSTDQHLWVGDGTTNRISKYDLTGKFLYGWGISSTIRAGAQPGWLDGPHQMSVDQEGNFYVAEVWSGRAQKFTPRKGVDPAKLVTAEPRLR